MREVTVRDGGEGSFELTVHEVDPFLIRETLRDHEDLPREVRDILTSVLDVLDAWEEIG